MGKFSRTKVISYRSKKWWDDEISTQPQATKRAPPDLYPGEAKHLSKIIKKK